MAVWSAAIVPAVAVKVVVVDAAGTVTDPGTLNAVALLDRATVPPPVFDRVTVQVLVRLLVSEFGVHERVLTATAVASETEAVRVLPFKEAVTVAVWSAAIVPAVAVKVAVVDPAGTVTDPGTVSAAALLDRATVPPPVFDRVTVQVLVRLLVSEFGVHERALTATAVASETEAVRVLPFNVAVRVAVWSAAIVPAVAVKVAVVDPAGTVTDPGTVSAAALLDRATVPPPVFDRVTVQVLVRLLLKEPGVQLRAVKLGATGTANAPPVPLMGSASPVRVAPRVSVTSIVVLATPGATDRETTATTPSPIVEAFKPARIQLNFPGWLEQKIDFPAVTAGPAAVASMETTSVAE